MKPMNILELVLGKLADKEQAMATFNAVGVPDLDAVPPEVDTGEPEELPVEAGPPTGGPLEDSGPPGDLPPMDAGRPEGVPPGDAAPPDFFNDMGLPTFAVAEGYPGEDDEEEDEHEDAAGLPDQDAVPPEVDAGKPDELPVGAGPPTGGPPEDSGPPEDLAPLDTGRPEGVPPGEDFFDHETGLPTVLVAEGFPGDREDDEVDDQIEDVDL